MTQISALIAARQQERRGLRESVDLDAAPGRKPDVKLRSVIVPGIAAVVVAIVALILAGPSTTAPTASKHQHRQVLSAKTVAISIKNYAYSPDDLTIKVGTTLLVTNHDMTQHTLTANSGVFDTGTIQPGQTKRVVLSKAGTYPYHCAFHAFMTGTIKVVS